MWFDTIYLCVLCLCRTWWSFFFTMSWAWIRPICCASTKLTLSANLAPNILFYFILIIECCGYNLNYWSLLRKGSRGIKKNIHFFLKCQNFDWWWPDQNVGIYEKSVFFFTWLLLPRIILIVFYFFNEFLIVFLR